MFHYSLFHGHEIYSGTQMWILIFALMFYNLMFIHERSVYTRETNRMVMNKCENFQCPYSHALYYWHFRKKFEHYFTVTHDKQTFDSAKCGELAYKCETQICMTQII